MFVQATDEATELFGAFYENSKGDEFWAALKQREGKSHIQSFPTDMNSWETFIELFQFLESCEMYPIYQIYIYREDGSDTWAFLEGVEDDIVAWLKDQQA